jgi:hypothetical protein
MGTIPSLLEYGGRTRYDEVRIPPSTDAANLKSVSKAKSTKLYQWRRLRKSDTYDTKTVPIWLVEKSKRKDGRLLRTTTSKGKTIVLVELPQDKMEQRSRTVTIGPRPFVRPGFERGVADYRRKSGNMPSASVGLGSRLAGL